MMEASLGSHGGQWGMNEINNKQTNNKQRQITEGLLGEWEKTRKQERGEDVGLPGGKKK